MKVRPAENSDLGAVVALFDEVHQIHVAARPDQFRPAPEEALAPRFREWLGAREAKVWVAELDGQVVGYAVQLLKQREPHPLVRERRWWEIDAIGVTAAHRNKGIGTAIIEAILHDASLSEVKDVELASWAFNTGAHRAFARAGFVPKYIRFELKR